MKRQPVLLAHRGSQNTAWRPPQPTPDPIWDPDTGIAGESLHTDVSSTLQHRSVCFFFSDVWSYGGNGRELFKKDLPHVHVTISESQGTVYPTSTGIEKGQGQTEEPEEGRLLLSVLLTDKPKG